MEETIFEEMKYPLSYTECFPNCREAIYTDERNDDGTLSFPTARDSEPAKKLSRENTSEGEVTK